jgi:hypothetical protein
MSAVRRRQPNRFQRLREGFNELRRTPVRFAVRLAVSRLITHWRSLLTIVAGAILAASIGALVPLYTTAIAQVGMLQRLDENAPRDTNITAQIMLRANEWADTGGLDQIAGEADQLVRQHVAADLGVIDDWVASVVSSGETGEMGILRTGDEPLLGIRARVGHYDGWQDQVRVVSGRLPQPGEAGDAAMEVVVSLEAANEIDTLSPDTTLIFDQRVRGDGAIKETSIPGYENNRPLTVQIVGVVAPLDPQADYWLEPSPLALNDRLGSSWDYEFVALTTRDNFYRAATDFLPGPHTRIGWRVLLAHDNLPFARLETARDALRTFENNLHATFEEAVNPGNVDVGIQGGGDPRNLQFQYYTQLTPHQQRDTGILKEYAGEVDLLGAPFGLLLLQVGALVLFFLMVTAALVRRGERREIAILQSRGAWDSQIVLLRGIEALLICALAVVVAPFLSQALLSALGPTITQTERFPLPLMDDAFIFAGLAAAVTFLALMFTLRPVLRMPLIAAGGAATRSGGQHWWQKYYIDVVLAGVGLLALGVLVRNGSPLADVNLGGDQADPLLLLAPALLFLALGSLALRFFPIIAQVASRIAATGRGALGSLASWQLSREPVHYGRITFLLALAIGIGWFATSFRATVWNSHTDQAKYSVGTDTRLTERDVALDANRARPAADYAAQDGIQAASVAYRLPGINLSLDLTDEISGDILAIDPATFPYVPYWRDDLGPLYLPRAANAADTLPPRGAELPFVPDRIGLWVRLEQLTQQRNYAPQVNHLMEHIDLRLRLLNADGMWHLVPVEKREIETEYDPDALFDEYPPTGWVYCEADLGALDAAGSLRLVSIFWDYRYPFRGDSSSRLTLADMTLIDAGGSPTTYPLFADDTLTWDFAYDRGATAEGRVALDVPYDPRAREESVYISWSQQGQRTRVGTLINYPDLGALHAIVSRRMQQANTLRIGADAPAIRLLNVQGRPLYIRPLAATEYYPSLYNRDESSAFPKGDAFVVVSVHDLLYHLNRQPSAAHYADEVWLRFDDGVDTRDKAAVGALIERLTPDGRAVILHEVTLAEELDRLRTDPLGLGLLGLMYLAFLMALTLSVVGLLTYAGLTAQARRTEFGVLRALGLSSLRVVAVLALEQVFVMVVGIALGATLGAVLADQVVPTLAMGAAGENITPPFVMRVGSQQIVEYMLLMATVLLLVLGSSVVLVRQLSLARTLRLGEE